MSNISHTDINLSELKNNIENDLYQIPKFQRDFIWKSSNIESLGDSIIRGYPISSILIMPVNGTLNICSESLNVNKLDLKKNTSSNSFYVLDGQQRITSIARIFCDLDKDIQYFFDCLLLLIEQFPDDRLERLSIYKNSLKKYLKMDYFCIGINRGNNKSFIENKENYRFIAASQMIKGKYTNLINKFIRTIDSEIAEDAADKYIDYLSFTFGKVSQYGISKTVVEGNSDLGVVCRIFEKINASGKKLTIFDLINAKSFDYKKYSKGLAQYLRDDLKLMSGKNNDSNLYFFEYKKDDFENLARVVRILIVIDLIKDGKAPQITNNVMLKKDSDYWFDMWDRYKKDIIETVKYFYNDGVLQISPFAFFEYMVAVICANTEIKHNLLFKNVVKKYALALSISGRSFSKSDLETVIRFDDFAKKLSLNKSQNILHLYPDTNISFDKNQLKSSTQSSNRFKAAYYIMLKEKFKGKFVRDITNLPICYSDESTYPHYLIPKLSDPICQSIANVIPLNKTSLICEIKDHYPESYLDKLKNSFGVDYETFLEDNIMFKCDVLDINFLEKRFYLICDYIKDYLSEPERENAQENLCSLFPRTLDTDS